MFWSSQAAKSRNCLFNFILGARGVGKTFCKKEDVINAYLKSGEEFVYMRRYKEELKEKNMERFFDDIEFKFPEHKFKYYQGTFYIDQKPFGYSMPLSTSKICKSIPYDKVATIIFDEFIIDKGYVRYLPDEVTNFLEAYSTIARMRDVKVWFLSNAISITNPYFTYFGIELPYGSNFRVKDDILIEVVEDDEHANAMRETRFGKLIKNTDYGAYAIDNKFLRDSSVFVEKKPSTASYRFAIVYRGEKYGIWRDSISGFYYCSNDVDPSGLLSYSVTLDDHQPNTVLLKGHGSSMFDRFIKAYKEGYVRFENVNLKNICQDILKMTM